MLSIEVDITYAITNLNCSQESLYLDYDFVYLNEQCTRVLPRVIKILTNYGNQYIE